MKKKITDYRGQWVREVCPKCGKKTMGYFYCYRCGYNALKEKSKAT